MRARAGRETRRRSTAATARVARATFERLRRNVGRGQGRIGRATGARRRGVGTTRPGSGGCCRMASAFPNPADAWATTWARILDLCADVNGAPLLYAHRRASLGAAGRHPRGGGEFSTIGVGTLVVTLTTRPAVSSAESRSRCILGAWPPWHPKLKLDFFKGGKEVG